MNLFRWFTSQPPVPEVQPQSSPKPSSYIAEIRRHQLTHGWKAHHRAAALRAEYARIKPDDQREWDAMLRVEGGGECG